MDQFKINAPKDYCKYFHTNSEGLVSIDGRGNTITLDMDLSTHMDCKSPEDLWNHRKTRQVLHSNDLPAQERGPPTAQLLPWTYPPQWAYQPYFAKGPPRDDDVGGSILRDPNIDQRLLGAAINQLPSHLSSRFVPMRSALLSHGTDSAENLHQVSPQSQSSAPPSESPTPDMTHKLIGENNRLREEFDRFKKH